VPGPSSLTKALVLARQQATGLELRAKWAISEIHPN